jgi:hypothetical protein
VEIRAYFILDEPLDFSDPKTSRYPIDLGVERLKRKFEDETLRVKIMWSNAHQEKRDRHLILSPRTNLDSFL